MPELSNLTPEVIIFGGLTLIGLALVTVIYRFIKFYGNHTNDVIDRNTDAWNKNTTASQKMTDTIERWHEKVEIKTSKRKH